METSITFTYENYATEYNQLIIDIIHFQLI